MESPKKINTFRSLDVEVNIPIFVVFVRQSLEFYIKRGKKKEETGVTHHA